MEGHPSEPIFNPDGTLTHSGARSVGGLVTGNNWIKRTTKTLEKYDYPEYNHAGQQITFYRRLLFPYEDFIEDKKTTPFHIAITKG